MTKVKICGLRSMEDIARINDLQPEFAGFILSKPFRRYISPETVNQLCKQLKETITSVGVFVNEPIHYIADLLNHNIITMAQLHGDEDESYINRLRRELHSPKKQKISKAFRIQSQSDIDIEKIQHCTADYILLDSGTGSGITFDWSLIKTIHRPYFLAGGLSPENVQQAILQCHPFAVDVSSSVETDGKKDPQKMQAFMEAVKHCDMKS